jgi:predicted nucleic acid-binding protein
MSEIIIDSNMLVGFFDIKDSLRAKAEPLVNALVSGDWSIFYLDCVINEVFSVVSRRIHEQKRIDQLQPIFERMQDFFKVDKITWTYLSVPRLYSEILEVVSKSQGALNFHDGLISLIARERGISYIASFDPDFDTISWITRIKDVADLAMVK